MWHPFTKIGSSATVPFACSDKAKSKRKDVHGSEKGHGWLLCWVWTGVRVVVSFIVDGYFMFLLLPLSPNDHFLSCGMSSEQAQLYLVMWNNKNTKLRQDYCFVGFNKRFKPFFGLNKTFEPFIWFYKRFKPFFWFLKRFQPFCMVLKKVRTFFLVL